MERRVTTNGKVYRVEFRDTVLVNGKQVPVTCSWTDYSPRYPNAEYAFNDMARMNESDERSDVWTPVAPLVESLK